VDCPQVGSPAGGHSQSTTTRPRRDGADDGTAWCQLGGEEGPNFPHMRVGLRHGRCRGGLEEIWLLPSTGSLRGGTCSVGHGLFFSCPFASFGIKVDMGSATRQAARYLEPRPGWVTASGPWPHRQRRRASGSAFQAMEGPLSRKRP
jgi:hypothetical protein